MRIAVVDNGLGGVGPVLTERRYPGHVFERVAALALPGTGLGGFDVLVAPNGTDHEALWRSRGELSRLLESGGAVMSFCGPVPDWLPTMRWRMSTDIPLRSYQARPTVAEHELLEGVDLQQVNLSKGKRGSWACGHLETSAGAEVVLADNRGRAILAVDDTSTLGVVVASASAPLPRFETDETSSPGHAFDRLFENLLAWTDRRVTQRRARDEAVRPPGQRPGGAMSRAAAGVPPRAWGAADGAARPARRIAALWSGVWSQLLVFGSEKYAPFFDVVYVGDLAGTDLTRYAGLYVPFQTNLDALAASRDAHFGVLERGGSVVFEGHGDVRLLPDARWVAAPVDQEWWLRDPGDFPCSIESRSHPVFGRLTLAEANWHHHGHYACVPKTATVLQRGRRGEIVTWVDESRWPGRLFATTQDCVVEMGVNQITHLDAFLDALVEWITGVRPVGRYAPPPFAL